MKIEELIRNNIKNMQPYASARHEYSGAASVYLDANENPFQSGYNRYPDPLQLRLKEKISTIKNMAPQNIFLGNGSDEAIDLLFRVFCAPGLDNVITCPPTYGMYEVCATVNDVSINKVNLTDNYQLDTESIVTAINSFTKLIFICSPNNPTGNNIRRTDIELLLKNFNGLVIIDEAYIDFSAEPSFLQSLIKYPNLVILQTFSKAWGLAGLRLGMAFASKEIIGYLNKIKYPYNINAATQQLALAALENISLTSNWTSAIIEQRELLKNELSKLGFIKTIFPSDANFLFVKTTDDKTVFNYLKNNGIIIRYKEGLRITVGTPTENKTLIQTLKEYEENFVY